ncbi:MAG: hypothetical protein GY798_19645 [Hyphomicrobiales bacterium]|nr:hypothetical protein [Hyphomicrobiales bacterium]
MTDEGEFYSEDFYRHRPWLLKMSKHYRVAVLVLAGCSFAARWALGAFLPTNAALGVAAVFAAAAVAVEILGRRAAKRRRSASE